VCFSSSGNAHTRTTASKATVRCHFHVVIVKSDFNFKEKKDALVLRSNIDKFGGWDDRTHALSVEK